MLQESLESTKDLTDLVDAGAIDDSNIGMERISDLISMQVPQPSVTIHTFTSSSNSQFPVTETGRYLDNNHPSSTKIFDMSSIIPSHNIADTLRIMHFSPKAHRFCKIAEPLVVDSHEGSAEVIRVLKLSNCLDMAKFEIPYTAAELIKLNANRAKIEFIYKLETTGLAAKETLSNYLYNMWTS